MKSSLTRQWLQLSLIWIVIALVPVGRVYLFEPYPFQSMFYIILLVLGLLLAPLLLLWIRFLQRKKFNWVKIILMQFLLAVSVSLLFHYAAGESSTTLKRRVSMQELRQMPAPKKMAFHLFSGSSYAIFTSLMMLSGVALLIEYNEQLRQKKNKETELKMNLVMSQIKVLQSELQPHFLFNTLHTASSLMEVDINKAQYLLERLSSLLRSFLEIINRHFYFIEEEIAFLKEYITIQELRYNGSIELSMQVPEKCMKLDIPVILLQPIIENSIKHGWIDKKKRLHVTIKVECANNLISITASDNGTPVNTVYKPGIGIRNLKERLEVLYGNTFSFTEQTNNGRRTHITFPVRS